MIDIPEITFCGYCKYYAQKWDVGFGICTNQDSDFYGYDVNYYDDICMDDWEAKE